MNNNQRDPRWANIKIDDMTIGQIGCTVSAIGDILNLTPDVVVAKLKAVNGFLGNLIIWAKIPEAFPGITINRVWSYNNDDVKANTPHVIVEVPASAIGGSGSHWVNYIGNKQCKDPWTGTIRPTSDFPNPTGYCVINGEYTHPVDNQAIIDELRVARDSNWQLYQTELAKNNELKTQLENEQKKSQELREANDKLTKADADTGAELIDVSHERDNYKSTLEAWAGALGSTIDLKSGLEAIEGLRSISQNLDNFLFKLEQKLRI